MKQKGKNEIDGNQNWIQNQFRFILQNSFAFSFKGKVKGKRNVSKKRTQRKKNFKSNYTAHKRNLDVI